MSEILENVTDVKFIISAQYGDAAHLVNGGECGRTVECFPMANALGNTHPNITGCCCPLANDRGVVT